MRKENLNIAAVVCVFLMTLAVPAGAITHYVAPGQSIQAAIDDANDGDQIEVAPGTYYERINMLGKAITLRSTEPSNPAVVDATIINGCAAGSVIICISGEDPNTVIDGFVITNGYALYGGGMYNNASSPTVKNCVFEKNLTIGGQTGSYPGGTGGDGGNGAGMYNVDASPKVINCAFIRNVTGKGGDGGKGKNGSANVDGGKGGTGGNGGYGAGMFNTNSSPDLKNCTFSRNETGPGGSGGEGGDGHEIQSDPGDGGDGGNGGNGAGICNCNNSKPIISNCTFGESSTGYGGESGPMLGPGSKAGKGGSGGDGAGSYNIDSTPEFISCNFKKNKTGNARKGSSGNGGGMYNNASSPVIRDCSFNENITGKGGTSERTGHGGNGGGMYNCQKSSPTITNCLFKGNRTGNGPDGGMSVLFSDTIVRAAKGGDGAGIYNDDSSPVLVNCILTDNRTGDGGNGDSAYDYNIFPPVPFDGASGGRGGDGGGMFNTNNASPTLTQCTFSSNSTGNGGNGYRGGKVWLGEGGDGGNGGDGGSGAGMYNNTSYPIVRDCTFSSNRTGFGGTGGSSGTGWWSGSPGKMGINGDGAGISNTDSWPDLTNCRFMYNTAFNKGGGIFNNTCSPKIFNCIFSHNRSIYSGGGMYNSVSNPTVVNCTFSNNCAVIDGGGIYVEAGSPTVTNCTFTRNFAGAWGGGMYNFYSSSTVTNCIVWGNTPDQINDFEYPTTITIVSFSDVQGGYTGTGNIEADPLFADIDGRLLSSSPCVGTGINDPNLPEKDLDGNPRITGTFVDMGAYEFPEHLILNVTRDDFHDTIQDAIDDANDFDQIRVLPRIYTEAIDFKGKAVRLYSSEGPEVTTIDGTGYNHVVKCVSGEGPNTLLDGFTITGGNANGSDPNDKRGGGMLNYASSPTVTNCIFTGNSADNYGGGMYNESSSPTVTNCTFSINTATEKGGAIANYLNSNPSIINCLFENNSATNYGGGLYNFYSEPVLTNCIFNQNEAQGAKGGGIANYDGSNSTITNCTFYGNSAHNDVGGAIRNYNCSPTITNCILWDNIPDEISSQSSSPVVSYSDVKGGHAGIGNIDADPLFENSGGGDYRLFSSLSPCVDAGDNTAPNLGDTDFEGNPRIRDGNLDGNDVVDMGALEFYGPVYNLTKYISYYKIQRCIDDAKNGDEIEVYPGLYCEKVNFSGKNIVLRSTDPNDRQVVSQTIIDGQHAGPVITFKSNEEPNCILSGFTITGGYVNPFNSTSGGAGIYCNESNPTIRNCNIVGNLASSRLGSAIGCNAASPSISECIISGNACGGVPGGTVVFGNGSDALLRDCTIQGNSSIEDGGILCLNSNPTIIRCSVTENSSSSLQGGGISCVNSDAVIDDCTITYNNAGLGAGSGEGGGIFCSGGNPTITRCRIMDNSASYVGGGIKDCGGLIENCEIRGNTSRLAGGGLAGCSGPIVNCIIADNQSYDGGGLFGCSGIVNCLIVNNSSERSGGGLRNCGHIFNSTIIANRTLDPIYTEGGGLSWCTGIITNNIIWDNYATTSENQLFSCSVPGYSCIQDWTGGGIGNTSIDPNFIKPGYWIHDSDPNIIVGPGDPNSVWASGNYRLSSLSPCIDAGNNHSAITGYDTDLNGWSRYINDLCVPDTGSGTAPIIDMGAYEFLPADIDGSGAVNLFDFGWFSMHWDEAGYEVSFLDQFEEYDPNAYSFENSYGSGGSFTVDGGKLNIHTGSNNTASVMTRDPVTFGVGTTISLDVPPVFSSESVFMMCSTIAGQPNGTSSFGFRFRRDGYARMHLYPGGIQTNTLDPDPNKPATLCVERTSDTDFYYSIIIDEVKNPLGSFALPELAGIVNLHIGAQAFDISPDTFSFDNLQTYKCVRLGGANLDGDEDVDWNDLRVLVDWWFAGIGP